MKKILLTFLSLIAFLNAGEVVANGKLYGEFVELTYGTGYDNYVVEYIQIGNINSFAKFKKKDKNEEEYMILANGYYSTEFLMRYIIPKSLFEELLEKYRVIQNKHSEQEKINKNILKSTNP